MDFYLLKIAGLLLSKNLENTVVQAAHLLPCHYHLVFKLDSLLLQRFGHTYSKN